MNKRERKNYLINRCYSAQYDKLPEAFRTVNALRYVGLGISIISNIELFNIQNLTPDCTDVLLNSGRYSAGYENLDYTLNVFYELNYEIEKVRFIGDDIFAYHNLSKLVKTAMRSPRVRKIELVSSGKTIPVGNNFDLLRNPGMKITVDKKGANADEIKKLLEENDINYEMFAQGDCEFCKNTNTIFVEGKVFRCPLSAKKYAESGEADESSYVDIVARKLQIKALRLSVFDITNSPPPENCDDCAKKGER